MFTRVRDFRLFCWILNSTARNSGRTTSHHKAAMFTCFWSPFFSRSVSHCSIDSTWFPFDEQSCSLIYESWRYGIRQVKFTPEYQGKRGSIFPSADFFPNALWEFVGRLTYTVHLRVHARVCDVRICTWVANLAKFIFIYDFMLNLMRHWMEYLQYSLTNWQDSVPPFYKSHYTYFIHSVS